MQVNGQPYRTVWMEGPVVKMINQPLIPHYFEIVDLPHHTDTARAIQTMIVRGAGAIGGSAGYGMAQVVLEAPDDDGFEAYVAQGAETMRNTRPTAQDLFYAIDKVLATVRGAASVAQARQAAIETAQAIADENVAACRAIAEHGAELVPDGACVLTHCNAGWLAFVDWGSALAPVYWAHRQGKRVTVLCDETRPRSQGARLSAWELEGEGVPHAVIADNAAGHLMAHGEIDLVIVGADRIAANGDVANKIGTYEKALCAAAHNIPFYCTAPRSTIDASCSSGDAIPIEERSADEVLYAYGLLDDGTFGRVRLVHQDGAARNPAFDVTPNHLVNKIITQYGIHDPSALPLDK